MKTKNNTKNKFILVLFTFLFLFSINLVYAQEKDPTFQFNKQFDLKRTCSNDGFFCDPNFVCNITLVYPNGELLLDNQRMTNLVSFRNITILQTQNNQLGNLRAIQSCDNSTSAGLETYDVIITADGNEFQAFPNEFVIIILSFLMIAIGITLDRLNMFKHLGSIMLMVMGVVTLYPGYNFINYSTLIGKLLGSVLVGLGFYFMIEDSFSRDKQGEGFDQKSEYVE